MKDRLSRRDFFKYIGLTTGGIFLERAFGQGERIVEQALPGKMYLDTYCGLNLGRSGLLLSGRDNIGNSPVFNIATLAQRGTNLWTMEAVFSNATEPVFSMPINPDSVVVGRNDGLRYWKKEGGVWSDTVLENGNSALPLIHLPKDEGDGCLVTPINNKLLSFDLDNNSRMTLAEGDIQGVFLHPNAKLVSATVNGQRKAWRFSGGTYQELRSVPQEDGLYRPTTDANIIIRQQKPDITRQYKPYEFELFSVSGEDIQSIEKITVPDVTTNYERLIGGLWNGRIMTILSARQQLRNWGGPTYMIDYVYRDFDPRSHAISPMQRISGGPYWFTGNASWMVDNLSHQTIGGTPVIRIATNDIYEPYDKPFSGILIPKTYTFLPNIRTAA